MIRNGAFYNPKIIECRNKHEMGGFFITTYQGYLLFCLHNTWIKYVISIIFKDNIKITNEDALIIQSNVARLREKRGEEIIGYKIGCVSKDTQKKMGFTQPACGYLWKSELYTSGIELNKKDYTNPAMEAEFGVILSRDIKPEISSFDYILESIEGIYP
jgi:2-keto-4-pentenoate hydratase